MGGANPLLSLALVATRDGTQHHWDGRATRGAKRSVARDPWSAFCALESDVRARVLDERMQRLFRVDGGSLSYTVSTGVFETLMTLEAPIYDSSDTSALDAQLAHVKAAADLRADRLPEICTQLTDILPFFGGLVFLHSEGTPSTTALLQGVLRLAALIEMPIKMHFDCPRPMDFAVEVQPLIQAPSHGGWPSGHATEAFAVATVLEALVNSRSAFDAVVAQSPFMRVAARIAMNRTIAGLHFPTDSFAGAALGMSLGGALVAHMSQSQSFEAFDYSGVDATDDFTLRTLAETLAGPAAKQISAAPEGEVLRSLWDQASAETSAG